MDTQYSELSINLTKSLSKTEKKEYGIYISPKNIIQKLSEGILKINKDIKRILEPSCGTCEIINHFDTKCKDIEIIGIEYNDKVFETIKNLTFNNNVKLIKQNFMEYETEGSYDLIVGNPPYFVCTKKDIPKKYHDFCIGRPNIFGLFIIHSLSMLQDGGILAFVVPKSFLNSSYYGIIRNYIKQICKIIEIIDFKDDNLFIDTEQNTFGLILQKGIGDTDTDTDEICNYSLRINDNYIFSCDTAMLKELFQGATTLEKMRFKVKTGTIVWNECKSELSNDEDDTLLLYNTNISNDNKLSIKKFKNDVKGQYIKRDGRIDPTLVVNRGNGNSSYKLNYLVVTQGPYLIENHLNEIYPCKKMKREELLSVYDKIINSFKNPKTQVFIDLFLGNNGLSKTELETIFPIYL